MDIRHKLNSYIPLVREIRYLEKRIEAIRDRQTSIRSSSDVSEVQACSSNSDKVGSAIVELIDLEEMYNEKIIKSTEQLKEIERMIDILTPTERLLIRARYIDGEYLEAVCGIIGYSYAQTKRIHDAALKKLYENEKMSHNEPS